VCASAGSAALTYLRLSDVAQALATVKLALNMETRLVLVLKGACYATLFSAALSFASCSLESDVFNTLGL
jgi:hypothetical protein